MTKRISEDQIVKILVEAKSGKVSIDELYRSMVYRDQPIMLGMTVSDIKKLKQIEEENRELKQMYADLSLEIIVLKNITRY